MAKNSINEEGDVRTLEQRVAKLERENSSLRNALSIIEGKLVINRNVYF